MSSQAILLGLDIGTSSTRAVAIDEQGTMRGIARMKSVPVEQRARQDGFHAESSLVSAVSAIRQALAEARARPEQVAGIAVCGQMAGLCFVDVDGYSLGVCDSWLDLDCASTLDLLRPFEQEVVNKSGGQLIASHAAKWLQLKLKLPDQYRQVCKLTTPSAFVAGRLTGLSGEAAFVDTTHLGFNNFADVPRGEWNRSLVHSLGLNEEHLPRIVEPWQRIGGLTTEFAGLTGLAQGTPLHAGCGDVAATLLGSAMFDAGQLVDISGTGAVLCAIRHDFGVDTQSRKLLTLRHCLPGLYYNAGYVGGAGLNFDWLESLQAGERPPHSVTAALRNRRGAAPLLFVPHMGGRHIPVMPDMRGAFVGLGWHHTLADMQCAMVEATAYEYASFKECMVASGLKLSPRAVAVVGGGATSDVFNQIKADVLGLPYARSAVFEAAAVGAALLAGHGAGVFADLRDAAKPPPGAAPVLTRPDMRRHMRYREHRAAYERLLEALEPVFTDIARLPR
ncbi:xylulokinase [Metapseudomonas sp. CR1201]